MKILTLIIVITASIFAPNNYKIDEQNKLLFDFDNEKYDKEYFLLGMLDEYLGYSRTFTGSDYLNQKVDITTTKLELKYLLFIDSLFNLEYSDITIVDNGSNIKICSPALSKRIDDFYIYKESNWRTKENDTVYYGYLNNEKFETPKQKLSFLLGAYVRYGKNVDALSAMISWFKKEDLLDKNKTFDNVSNAIEMGNSWVKLNFCSEILGDFYCKDIEIISISTFPTLNYVFFAPSDIIQEVISEAERLKRQIETINTNVNFTRDGSKFIWDGSREPPMRQ